MIMNKLCNIIKTCHTVHNSSSKYWMKKTKKGAKACVWDDSFFGMFVSDICSWIVFPKKKCTIFRNEMKWLLHGI